MQQERARWQEMHADSRFWLVAGTHQIGLVSKLSHDDAIQRPGKRIDVVAAQEHRTCKKLAADDCACTARETSMLPMTCQHTQSTSRLQAPPGADLVQQDSTNLAGSKATKQKAMRTQTPNLYLRSWKRMHRESEAMQQSSIVGNVKVQISTALH